MKNLTPQLPGVVPIPEPHAGKIRQILEGWKAERGKTADICRRHKIPPPRLAELTKKNQATGEYIFTLTTCYVAKLIQGGEMSLEKIYGKNVEDLTPEQLAAYHILAVDPEEARLLAKARSQGKDVKKWLRLMVGEEE
jgi:hypothetical protein